MLIQSILISIALGLSSNLDNIPVGLTCGRRKLKIPLLYTALASLASFAACWLAGTAGSTFSSYVPFGTSKWLGSTILILVGLWMGVQILFDKRRESERDSEYRSERQSQRDSRQNSEHHSERNSIFPIDAIGFSEWMFIGLTQVMANLAIGFAVGFAHHSVLATAICIGAGSGLLLNISAWVGRQSVKRQSRKVSWRTSFVSGLLLIVIGLYL